MGTLVWSHPLLYRLLTDGLHHLARHRSGPIRNGSSIQVQEFNSKTWLNDNFQVTVGFPVCT